MPVTSSDFRQFANSLLQTGTTEIYFRNSASRMYYSAFHKTRELIESRPSLERYVIPGGTHRRLIEQFLVAAAGSTERKLGTCLQYMAAMRSKADYALSAEFS